MESLCIPFDNTYARLPENFFQRTLPAVPRAPCLISWNEKLALELGLDRADIDDASLAKLFSGAQIPVGADPIALAYAGHQFGYFVPLLGDGRAHLLGELVSPLGQRWDIQLKGSGRTGYSRKGDGRSALGPVLREYILSEAMSNLGIPGTRALAAVSTGEMVMREIPLPGAVLTRVSPSHIRVGSFSYFADKGQNSDIKILLEYAVDRHYPYLKRGPDLPLEFLREVVRKQATLLAQWMSVGFIHGVMNTDNTAIAGMTIDYGPCAFMDEFKVDTVFSSIDNQGRYSYGNQPQVALWNLSRLAEALLDLIPGEPSEAVRRAETVLESFSDDFHTAWLMRMTEKLGIRNYRSDDHDLVQAWLDTLEAEAIDFTLGFRSLSGLVRGRPFPRPLSPAAEPFLASWRRRLDEEGLPSAEVAAAMDRVNPLYIPRNHLVEAAIARGIEGDFEAFHALNLALENPFEEKPGWEQYALPPRDDERVLQTFCGT